HRRWIRNGDGDHGRLALYVSCTADFAVGHGSAWGAGHPGELYVEQVDRYDQPGARWRGCDRCSGIGIVAGSVRYASGKGTLELRYYKWIWTEPGAGLAPCERRFSQADQQEDYRRLGDAEHFKHQLWLAVHGVLGNPANGRWVDGRGPARPDCEATSFDGAQRPERLLWRGSREWPGVLQHSRVCAGRHGAEPRTVWHAGAEHVPWAGVLQLRLCVHQGHP